MSSWNVKVGETASAAKGVEALVAEANAEREGRRADRLRIRAIVRIQSAVRALRERSNVMNKISSKILDKYQSAVLDTEHSVEPAALLKEVIGPLTVICTKYERRSIIQRPVPSVARKKLHAAVSVAFALSIRSLTATVQDYSLVCHSLDDPPRAMWAWPAYAVLCAHVAIMDEEQTIFGDEAQAVAAARCMFLLLDTPLPMAARTPEVMQLRSKLVLRTAASLSKSMALFTATSSCLPPPPGGPPPRSYPKEEDGDATSRSNTSVRQGSHLSRLQSNLVRAAVAVVCHQQPASPGSPCEPLPHDSLYSDDALRSAAHHWMTQLLSTPKILANQQLIREAIRVAPERFYTPLLSMLHGKGTGDIMVNLSALCALTMLMVGPSVQVHEMRTLQPCKVLKDKRMLQIYLAACTRTVGKAATGTHASAASVDANTLLRVLAWPFTQNAFLRDLIAGSDIDMSSAQVSTSRRLHSRMSMPDAFNDGFGMLITLYHSWIKLMRTLARDSQKTQAGTSTALEEEAAASIAEGAASTTPGTAALATDSATKKAPSEASQGAEAFVNLLAYNTDWMQKLWKRASMLCHLPHEVHAESTVGNDIPTLKGGIVDLEESPREALHLFCELLTHALVVTGDDAFHDGDEPLPLPCLRAVTVSLNSLVFHSCMKPDEVAAVSTLPAAAKLDESQQQLFTLAGRCLQQLHSRHVRRPFTPESAWLAPWNAWSGNNTAMTQEAQPELRKLTGLTLCVMLARATADEAGDGKPAEANGPASAVADLLQIAPHSVPYALRVDMFRQLLRMDKESITGGRRARKVTIRRDCVLEDAYKQLAPLGTAIKEPFMVVFFDEHGAQEAGIDQGGLLKELLELILEKSFDGDMGLVQRTADGKAFPSPQAQCVPNGLSLLEFVGMIVGKALCVSIVFQLLSRDEFVATLFQTPSTCVHKYEGMLLDIELAPLSVLVLQHRHPALEDVYTLDPELYQSLMKIKDYAGEASDLGLYFVVEEDVLGQKLEHELIPRGKETPVTNDNKLMYVYLCSHWHISRISGAASRALSRGLSKVVPIQFLRMFTVSEVNEVLGGTAGAEGIDIDDMMQHCQYKGGYSKHSPTIKMFWRAVMSFDATNRRLLLKFITGTGRAPLGGFANLAPPLVIYKVDCQAPVFACFAGQDVDRLPSASTCFSTLKLPNYRRYASLRSKLLYAITSKAGFDLS